MKTKLKHHIIKQMIEEQQWQKDNGPIVLTADQMWKYSGKIEPYNEEYVHLMQEEHERTNFLRYYKKRIRNKDIYLLLNSAESRIVDYFYKTCNSLTIVDMSKDLGYSNDYIEKVISKHLKIQKDDKNNTGELP